MPRSIGGLARALIGLLISVIAIALVLRSVDVDATREVLAHTSPGWLLVSVGFIVIDVVIRAIRWRLLLAPVRDVPFRRVLSYTLVGYVANNVLPARLGELVRSHYLGDREGFSRTTALGTVVVERVVDTAVVVAIAAFAILVLNVRGVVTSAVLIGAAVVALLVIALAIGIAAHRLPGARAIAAYAERWPRLRSMAGRLQDGLAVAGRPRTLLGALALSVAAWGATLLAFAAAGQAVGLQLRIGEAALLSAGVALASAIPSGPGYLGTYELAAVKIAEALGIPADPAFAMALLVHASILAVTTVGGVVALARLGWSRASPEPEPPTAEPAAAEPAAADGAPAPSELTPARVPTDAAPSEASTGAPDRADRPVAPERGGFTIER